MERETEGGRKEAKGVRSKRVASSKRKTGSRQLRSRSIVAQGMGAWPLASWSHPMHATPNFCLTHSVRRLSLSLAPSHACMHERAHTVPAGCHAHINIPIADVSTS